MGYRAELWVQGRSLALGLFSWKQIRHLPLHTRVALGPPLLGYGKWGRHEPPARLAASRSEAQLLGPPPTVMPGLSSSVQPPQLLQQRVGTLQLPSGFQAEI